MDTRVAATADVGDRAPARGTDAIHGLVADLPVVDTRVPAGTALVMAKVMVPDMGMDPDIVLATDKGTALDTAHRTMVRVRTGIPTATEEARLTSAWAIPMAQATVLPEVDGGGNARCGYPSPRHFPGAFWLF